MDKIWQYGIEQIIELTQTSKDSGLSSKIAKERLALHGENRLRESKEQTVFRMFLSQFQDFLVIILIIAAIVSMVMHEIPQGIIILCIVFCNAGLGVFQENRANNALKALREMAQPSVKVIRDGALEEIEVLNIVPGDLVVLEAGDYVPADLRLIESSNLKIDESALTGESVPVEKKAEIVLEGDCGIGDRINCAFMSTIVTNGRGKGIVTGTGMDTEIGAIARLMESSGTELTPLQKKMNRFGKTLGIICIGVCAAIFLLGIVRGDDPFIMFMTAVSLAVAAVPEGLTAVITIVLALGMQRMVKVNAIVKKLSAVETLGSTTVICSDKTGTLTQNKMTVVELYDGAVQYEVTGLGYQMQGDIQDENGVPVQSYPFALSTMLECMALCNDAVFFPEKEEIIGDPTEGALLVLSAKAGLSLDDLLKQFPRVSEIPFDSERKLMSTFHTKGPGAVRMYMKGAPDEALKRSSYICRGSAVEPITEEDKNRILDFNQKAGEKALRVLAFCWKDLEQEPDLEQAETDLIFAGLACMIDPPREEAVEAVGICKQAGIRPVMITGDHKVTAAAIAEKIGIIEPGGAVISGSELEVMGEEELKDTARKVSVFARVSPEHKVRLVEAMKQNGEITAMTGDGVNDAPALKRADIGIAMGITGTDVSKEAADVILTDDNFATIIKSVEEGRVIYSNIRKVAGYLLSCNIGEIILIVSGMLAGFPAPLAAAQLLFVNMVTDAFPAFALGMEEKEDGVMEQPPRRPEEPLINRKMAFAVGIQSIALAMASLISYSIIYWEFNGLPWQHQAASTAAFITLIFGELLRAYSARSEDKLLFQKNLLSNRFLNRCILLSFAATLLAVYLPVMQTFFNTYPLTLRDLDIALLLSILPVLGGEASKLINRIHKQ